MPPIWKAERKQIDLKWEFVENNFLQNFNVGNKKIKIKIAMLLLEEKLKFAFMKKEQDVSYFYKWSIKERK